MFPVLINENTSANWSLLLKKLDSPPNLKMRERIFRLYSHQIYLNQESDRIINLFVHIGVSMRILALVFPLINASPFERQMVHLPSLGIVRENSQRILGVSTLLGQMPCGWG